MTRSSSPNISSLHTGYNAAAPTRRVPKRDELEAHRVRVLKQGGPTKADLTIVDLGEGPMVVKDFGAKRGWVRLIGRIQISREVRAYRWLGSFPGVARCIGRIDAHALALEWIDGAELADAPREPGDGPKRLALLQEIVARMHRAGLAHLDLRGRENVMLDVHGGIHVLDLASAFWARPGGLADRLLGRRLQATDRAALLKWKRLLDAGPYTEEEQAFLRRHRFWRSLWIFNRKRKHKGGGG